jgi:SPP1 gp7 family putative phage head morphogenesis protein
MPDVEYGNLPFLEAIKHFQDKGLKIAPASWRDLWQQAQIRAFTVARVTAMDVLIDIRKEVDTALTDGISLGEFKKNLRGKLETKGWFAPKGEKAEVKLPDGTVRKRLTGWRMETIYRTNLQTAYSAGRHKQMMESVTRIYWQYNAIMDAVTRPEHAAQHGKVYHRDHPFWDKWYPPNGFNCRCYVTTLSVRQMDQRGLAEETQGVEELPDEGWRYNPGKEPMNKWQPDLSKYPEELAKKFKGERPVFD